MIARRHLAGSGAIEINSSHPIYSVLFSEDGKQVLSGGIEGILQWWRVEDGQKVGEPIRTEGPEIYSAAISPDRKWLVCGFRPSRLVETEARVWNMQTRRKVFAIKGRTCTVFSVDVSPDSTKFATGPGMSGSETLTAVSIWSMTSAERLVGPLWHDGWVVAVRFSPNGDRLATATAENPDAKSIRVYDSENGQLLLDIPFRVSPYPSASLAWSSDGGQLFAASYSEVRLFDTSSGSLLSKWTVPGDGYTSSIALSRNQKFIAVIARRSLSFWDTSTRKQIGTTIEHTDTVLSIALSHNDDCIATGERNGKVTLRSLRDILPGSYFASDVRD